MIQSHNRHSKDTHMSQDTVRVGIIELGIMCGRHYEAYQNGRGCEVVAVADDDQKRGAGGLTGVGGKLVAGGISQLLQITYGTSNWRELLAMSEVDVVDVCLLSTAHEVVVIAA